MGYDDGVGSGRNGYPDNVYFAKLEPNKLTSACISWVQDYAQYLLDTGRNNIWRRSYEMYYRGLYRGGRIVRVGDQGQYYSISLNHYRNLLTHMLVMTTSQRPAFEPRATNTDHKSQAQCLVATGILDYYNRDQEMDYYLNQAVEINLVFGESFVTEEWDTSKGDVYSKLADGKVIRQGDVSFNCYSPLEVISDFTASDPKRRQWRIIRDLQNKFDLAAKYPELAGKIIDYTYDQTLPWASTFDTRYVRKPDLIPVYKFYHERTPAVPEGRMFQYIDADCWLLDGPLPYDTIPVHRMAAADQQNTTFGYTIAFDLLPLQEAVDNLASTIITNQAKFGVQNILVPEGSTVSAQQLMDGLNVINYDPKHGPPSALQLLSTPPEIFNFLSSLVDTMETIAGVNSVARGNPEASLKSGAALALVQSMAIQFNSGLQHSYAKLLESLGTGLINILKRYASTPRIAAISGKTNKSYLKEFTGQDLSTISRVTVDMGNPLSRTTAGKVNMADSLMQAKLIDDPQQYLQVIQTGKLEPMIEGETAELMLIRSENEALSNGEDVSATAIDDHSKHILEHKSTLASPESRRNPAVVQRVLAHCMQHIQLWRTTDPSLLAMLGQTPPPPMAGGPAVGAPGVPQPTDLPAGGGDPFNPQPPVVQEAENINLPKMPDNAMTGAPFDVVSGGL